MSYIKIEDRPFIYVDIDETLISHFPITKKSDEFFLDFEHNRVKWRVYPMVLNIDLISELRSCGYQIACWSLSGSDHAERMIKLLEIENLVDLIVPKPRFYVDDKPFEDQGIPRIYKK